MVREAVDRGADNPRDPFTANGDGAFAIEVKHLTKRYGEHTVVSDLSFIASPGRVTGFLGPNGSGKSTTMKIMLDLASSEGGRATIGGSRYRDLPDPTAVVGALDGWDLDGVQAIVALSPSPAHFTPGDLDHLRQFLRRDGMVVTSPEVGAVLEDAVREPPELVYDGLVEQRGNLYLAQKGIAVLFEDDRHKTLSGFWREVLGLEEPQAGYRIATDDYIFHYQIGAEPVGVDWALPFEAAGYRYDDEARPTGWFHGKILSTVLGRREYVFLQRIWPFWLLV